MSSKYVMPFPLVVRTPRYEVAELWRMTLRGDDAARRELLRRIMPARPAPVVQAPIREERAAA